MIESNSDKTIEQYQESESSIIHNMNRRDLQGAKCKKVFVRPCGVSLPGTYVDKANFFWSPREGYSIFTIFEPYKSCGTAEYEGGDHSTEYELYHAFFHGSDKKDVGAPEKMILQLPKKCALRQYRYVLELNDIPCTADHVNVVVYVQGKYVYRFYPIEDKEFKDALKAYKTGDVSIIESKIPPLKRARVNTLERVTEKSGNLPVEVPA